MREPIWWAKTPLFERFVDRNPQALKEVMPDNNLDEAAFHQSLHRALVDLLNTQSNHLEYSSNNEPPSVFAYGIPPWSHIAAGDEQKSTALARQVERAIERYEPRLGNVRVAVVGSNSAGDAVGFEVQADAIVNRVKRSYNFEIKVKEGRLV